MHPRLVGSQLIFTEMLYLFYSMMQKIKSGGFVCKAVMYKDRVSGVCGYHCH